MYHRKKKLEKMISVSDEVKAELAEIVSQDFISIKIYENPQRYKNGDYIY